nr:MAG TPA: hypothetical protein [Caudoviricetes sp.]
MLRSVKKTPLIFYHTYPCYMFPASQQYEKNEKSF